MRFVSRIDVFLPGDIVERSPTAWDRLRALWGPVDLGTRRVRDKIEAATFVYEFRTVLDAMGIDNARSLVVDGTTVFQDAKDEDADLPDLVLAFSEHVALFGESCGELRLSVEHEEAGLRLIVDATVASEHDRAAPSARIGVWAELVEIEPRRGESAEAYRERIAAFLSDSKAALAGRLQFGTFVSRFEAALTRVFTETRFDVTNEVLDVALPSSEAAFVVEERAPSSTGPPKDTAVPPRNFTLATEQRIAALMSGPPAFAVRLRRIEDLEGELIAALRESGAAASGTIPLSVARGLEELNRLIGNHNRNYPVERNLPLDPATGRFLDMGKAWKPRPAVTIDELWRRARARSGRTW